MNFIMDCLLRNFFSFIALNLSFKINRQAAEIISISTTTGIRLAYCQEYDVLGTSISEVYGSQCGPEPSPSDSHLSAEQGVAIAIGVLLAALLLLMFADHVYRKAFPADDGKDLNELEMRERGTKGSEVKSPPSAVEEDA